MRTTETLLLKKSQIFHNTKGCSPALHDGNRAYDLSTDSVGVVSNPATRARALKIAWTWRKVVWEYSNFKISMARDRLPALGAIAQQFHNVRPNEQYLAGLWSGTLLQDLLWICSSSPTKHDKKKLLRHPNLPSWSWASLQSPIWYHAEQSDITPKATVVEARCRYADGNMFGILECSRLILRGRLLSGTLEWSNKKAHNRPFDLFFLDGDTRVFLGTNSIYNIKLDHDQDGHRGSDLLQEVHILEVFIGTGSSLLDRGWQFLILRRECQAEMEHIYTRAGVLLTFYYEGQDLQRSKGRRDSQPSFQRLFEAQSVLTTCEIR